MVDAINFREPIVSRFLIVANENGPVKLGALAGYAFATIAVPDHSSSDQDGPPLSRQWNRMLCCRT